MPDQSSLMGKEPWLAVLLSTIFPGIGQFYAGKTQRAWMLLGAAIALTVMTGWLIFSPGGSFWIGLLFLFGYVILSVFNLFDAHRCARKANNQAFEVRRKEDNKDPWLAVFLSRIFPGLGHAYQRQWAYAALFFFSVIVASALSSILSVFSLVGIGLTYFCLYHAYMFSPAERPKSQRLIVRVCLVLLLMNLLSLLLAFSLRTFVAEARYIPSGGMEPTLQVNDRLIVEKLSYRLTDPQRGDIVVFFVPPEALPDGRSRSAFIQRVIGLPGDTVEVRRGTVFINGEPLEENYIKAEPEYVWGPEEVPEDAYFVLGDNRNNSYDSHHWGFVPRANIRGRASKIFWPLSRSGPIE